jgi:SAM-dependent methyltransferase
MPNEAVAADGPLQRPTAERQPLDGLQSREEPKMDIWGRLYRDHYEGHIHPYAIERDDGLEHRIESAEAYFKAPRSEVERQLLDALDGVVLDLGAGAGSYALYLQARGLDVTAIDQSEGAIEVCRHRGCRDARVMDIRSLELERARYSAIMVMGNTLGIHQTPETLPALLRTLAHAARPEARLLCVTLDPLDTVDPDHLRYHQRNRERGRPPGLSTMRLKYRDWVDAWADLWMPTSDEMQEAVASSPWSIVDERAQGPNRLRLLGLRRAASEPAVAADGRLRRPPLNGSRPLGG